MSTRSAAVVISAFVFICVICYIQQNANFYTKCTVRSTTTTSQPISKRTIELYNAQANERRNAMKAVLRQSDKNYLTLYNVLVPEVACAELVRVGTVLDGGKWMCSPFDLPADCTILSLGLNNRISFELELQSISSQRCSIVAYDKDEQSEKTRLELHNVDGESKKAMIALETNEDKGEFSLSDLMADEGVHRVEILKMDIEGAELTVLPKFLEDFKPAQILVEVHGSPKQMAMLLSSLSSHGYWLFSYEINGKYHNLCEFSLLHENAFTNYSATPIAQYLDKLNS